MKGKSYESYKSEYLNFGLGVITKQSLSLFVENRCERGSRTASCWLMSFVRSL